MTTPLGRLSDDELRAHGPWLVHLARGLVGGEAEAEDLAQDVWLELARGSGPVAHLRALAASVARRLAGHRRAAERAREERERRSARAEALPGADELQGALDAQRVLLEELSALDELDRTPLLLHYYEGLSAAEIARRRGQPATTVRHQLERARHALRARLERRQGGERALWVALAARVPRRAGWTAGALTGGMLMTTLGKTCVAAGVLGALVVGWRVSARGGALAPENAPAVAGESAALAEPRVGGPEPLTTPASAAGTRAASALTPPRSARTPDVPVLVRDDDTGQPLSEFTLGLARDGGEAWFQAATDARGRATIEARWFEEPFRLQLQGDPECSFEERPREFGPADRPADGEPLVLTCATGPSYTLLFDAPAPPTEELRACLSAGTEPPVDPFHFVRLHRDGARVWTRFPRALADERLGDGPWTLSVLSVDGLWRAHGPVTTIVGEQREPVRLTGELCGALTLELECDTAPEANDFALGVDRLDEGGVAAPRHAWIPPWQSERFFGHLVPGEYGVWANSPVHETASRRVRVVAGVSEVARLALVPRAGVAPLRVVITSETGTLDLAPLGAMARELATGAWRNTNHSEELHPKRLELLFEGLTDTEYEVTLVGLVTFGALDFAPGRSAIVRPGQGELVFTALDAHAPPRREARVRVLSGAGEPLRAASVLTYFDGWQRGSGETDEEGVAHLEPISEGVRFDVVVAADGCRPRVLRGLALPLENDELELRLEPGWGAWLDVVCPSAELQSAPPFHPAHAAGARLLLDGLPAGVLDERGQLLLTSERAPQRIEILYPGYHVAAGDLDATTGSPPVRDHLLWVELAPDAR